MQKNKNEKTKAKFRAIGIIFTIIGGLLTIVGIGSFIYAFTGFGFPSYFFCAIIGLPLLGIGINFLRLSHLREFTSYTASQTAPVFKETAEYIFGEVKECPNCSAKNDANASYCTNCGCKLNKYCPKCGAEVSGDDNYCKTCGGKL